MAGLPTAIARLKRHPRETFMAPVSDDDDRMMYQSVRSTMSEVYQMILDSDGIEELDATTGLMHFEIEAIIASCLRQAGARGGTR